MKNVLRFIFSIPFLLMCTTVQLFLFVFGIPFMLLVGIIWIPVIAIKDRKNDVLNFLKFSWNFLLFGIIIYFDLIWDKEVIKKY